MPKHKDESHDEELRSQDHELLHKTGTTFSSIQNLCSSSSSRDMVFGVSNIYGIDIKSSPPTFYSSSSNGGTSVIFGVSKAPSFASGSAGSGFNTGTTCALPSTTSVFGQSDTSALQVSKSTPPSFSAPGTSSIFGIPSFLGSEGAIKTDPTTGDHQLQGSGVASNSETQEVNEADKKYGSVEKTRSFSAIHVYRESGPIALKPAGFLPTYNANPIPSFLVPSNVPTNSCQSTLSPFIKSTSVSAFQLFESNNLLDPISNNNNTISSTSSLSPSPSPSSLANDTLFASNTKPNPLSFIFSNKPTDSNSSSRKRSPRGSPSTQSSDKIDSHFTNNPCQPSQEVGCQNINGQQYVLGSTVGVLAAAPFPTRSEICQPNTVLTSNQHETSSFPAIPNEPREEIKRKKRDLLSPKNVVFTQHELSRHTSSTVERCISPSSEPLVPIFVEPERPYVLIRNSSSLHPSSDDTIFRKAIDEEGEPMQNIVSVDRALAKVELPKAGEGTDKTNPSHSGESLPQKRPPPCSPSHLSPKRARNLPAGSKNEDSQTAVQYAVEGVCPNPDRGLFDKWGDQELLERCCLGLSEAFAMTSAVAARAQHGFNDPKLAIELKAAEEKNARLRSKLEKVQETAATCLARAQEEIESLKAQLEALKGEVKQAREEGIRSGQENYLRSGKGLALVQQRVWEATKRVGEWVASGGTVETFDQSIALQVVPGAPSLDTRFNSPQILDDLSRVAVPEPLEATDKIEVTSFDGLN